jgi:hypothetical protein
VLTPIFEQQLTSQICGSILLVIRNKKKITLVLKLSCAQKDLIRDLYRSSYTWQIQIQREWINIKIANNINLKKGN